MNYVGFTNHCRLFAAAFRAVKTGCDTPTDRVVWRGVSQGSEEPGPLRSPLMIVPEAMAFAVSRVVRGMPI